ncbi:S8 family serine peptidase [Streptomyces adustus]|uniref:S8 family serine peptidase n=1 Tax=Streptomyces adustus TaxID=1609272 RepID=A0A5N8VCG3_9ACTN|nr:S8 family serine peptidase [Streptomyces adustus]MPY32941.1 S8 family serine peptidase [Streptomyces adustus]
MRSSLRSSLGLGVAFTVAGGLLSAVPAGASASSHDPEQRVIVQLAAASAAASRGRLTPSDTAAIGERRQEIGAEQKQFLRTATDAGVHPRIVRRLQLLTDAVAMSVPASEVKRLSDLPGVASVVPDTVVRTQSGDSVPLVGAPEAWRQKTPSGAVDGTGVTIAVIDSGIDYTHPDLGGGFGPGHKVVAGHDFVNNDDDPMDDNGHGTHVAGIAAARAAEPGGITGIAPGATLTAYKVVDDSGSGFTSDIIAGIEAATDPANPHRADVINMSLGTAGDGTDPLGQAAAAAVRAGVVVVAAAGNDGPNGWTVNSPAGADGVIAVGASTTNLSMPSLYTSGAKPQLLQSYRGALSANPPKKPVTADVVDIGAGGPDDWRRAGDVHGKMVLTSAYVPAKTGELTADQLSLSREAEKRGAIALIGGPGGGDAAPQAVPSEPGVATVSPSAASALQSGDSLRMDSLVTLGTDEFQYVTLQQRLAKGRLRLTLHGTDATDQIASFSSRGPTPRFGLKPDVVAPGVEIRSTVPTALWKPGQYRMSGTSMAAPHVAGAAALLRQLHPRQSPGQIKSELVGTARHLDDLPVTTQGSGRLDVVAAARSELTTSPATVSFGLADLSTTTVRAATTVTLTNTGDRSLRASLTATGSARVSPGRVTLPAHGTNEVTVTLTAARPAADTELDGAVVVKPERGPQISVPYLLPVLHLDTQASPDPSDGHTVVYVDSPTDLKAPPTVTVTSPRGTSHTYTAVFDHDHWYSRALEVSDAGVHHVETRATTAGGQVLVGSDSFEVTAPVSGVGRWRPVGPSSESGTLTQIPGRPGQAVLVQVGKAGVWFTADNGRTWSERGRLPVASADGHGKVIVDAHDPNRWWYAVDDSILDRTWILRTDDQGLSWRLLDTTTGLLQAFVADATTRTLVAVSEHGWQVSKDGGASWQQSSTDIDGFVSSAAVDGDDLYLSTAGAVWVRSGMTSGLLGPLRRIYQGTLIWNVVADAGTVAAYVVDQGVMVSSDRGATWDLTLNLPYTGNSVNADHGDLLISAGSDNVAYISHDHGRTWGDFPLPTRKTVLDDYDRWPDGSVTVSSEGDGLYRSTADGSGSHRIGVQGASVNALAVSGGNLLAATKMGIFHTALPVSSPEWGPSDAPGAYDSVVTQVTSGGKGSKVAWKVVNSSVTGEFHVERSDDGGRTWQERGTYSGAPLSLLADPADADRVYVSFSRFDKSGLYTTDDGGSSWRVLYQSRGYSALAADPAKSGRLWLGGPDGLFRSDDGGATVTKVADGLVSAIELDGSRLLVGGNGIRLSTDAGRTFRTADTGGLPTRVMDLQRVGRTLYAASGRYSSSGLLKNGRGVLRSTDGGVTWDNISGGLECTDVTSLAADPNGKTLYVGTVNGGVHRLDLRH